MKGQQCDTCRAFSKNETGWFAIIQYGDAGWGNPFSGPAYQTEGTFCSMRCLAELSYAYVVINDKTDTRAAD